MEKGFLEQRTLPQTHFCSRNFSHFSHRLLNVECPHRGGPYTRYLPSAPSFTHPLIISFTHPSSHACALTHTEKYGGQGLISECLSQSCLHLVSFNFITFIYVCVYVRVRAHVWALWCPCDQRTAGRVSSRLLQPHGPCKLSF